MSLSSSPPAARMLVVDDNPDVAGIVRLAIRRLSRKVEVVAENNADRAVKLLREQKFDLVLSDFRMREMDGLKLLAHARDAQPQTPRLLFTAYGAGLDPAELAAAGAHGLLEKPLLPSVLGEVLDAVLAGDAATMSALRRALEARTTPLRQ